MTYKETPSDKTPQPRPRPVLRHRLRHEDELIR